ncbi:MAG: hypothetical protein ACE5OO_02070, partial [Candidatus Bathyarchaeia archaeon]
RPASPSRGILRSLTIGVPPMRSRTLSATLKGRHRVRSRRKVDNCFYVADGGSVRVVDHRNAAVRRFEALPSRIAATRLEMVGGNLF